MIWVGFVPRTPNHSTTDPPPNPAYRSLGRPASEKAGCNCLQAFRSPRRDAVPALRPRRPPLSNCARRIGDRGTSASRRRPRCWARYGDHHAGKGYSSRAPRRPPAGGPRRPGARACFPTGSSGRRRSRPGVRLRDRPIRRGDVERLADGREVGMGDPGGDRAECRRTHVGRLPGESGEPVGATAYNSHSLMPIAPKRPKRRCVPWGAHLPLGRAMRSLTATRSCRRIPAPPAFAAADWRP